MRQDRIGTHHGGAAPSSFHKPRAPRFTHLSRISRHLAQGHLQTKEVTGLQFKAVHEVDLYLVQFDARSYPRTAREDRPCEGQGLRAVSALGPDKKLSIYRPH